jgi:hypothetical protein
MFLAQEIGTTVSPFYFVDGNFVGLNGPLGKPSETKIRGAAKLLLEKGMILDSKKLDLEVIERLAKKGSR